MNSGTFHVVGLGPGEPDLLTLKAARLLRQTPFVYVPFSRLTTQTWVEDAVREHTSQDTVVTRVEYSLEKSSDERKEHWRQVAQDILQQLRQGKDVLFVTLGDPLLYSTAIYLIRALREQWPGVAIDIVPGISAYSHCAALTSFAVGEGTKPVTIFPTVLALADIQSAIERGGTLILMKIGRYLPELIDLLEKNGLIERSVFVARAGLPDQQIKTDLRALRGADPASGNLAVILVHTEEVNQ